MVQPLLPCRVFHEFNCISIQVDILVRADVSPSFCYLHVDLSCLSVLVVVIYPLSPSITPTPHWSRKDTELARVLPSQTVLYPHPISEFL